MIAQENIYVDASGNIVDESDPKAAFLLAGKGTEIPQATVEKYGLGKKKAVSDGADGEKASSGPTSNKAARPKSNK